MARRAEAVVFIRKVEGRSFELPRKNPVVDQKDLIFVPHVQPVLVGATVDFPNTDTVRHNVYASRQSPVPFNLGQYPAGEVKSVAMDKEGIIELGCNVHAEMSAFVVVCQNPYFAVTDKTGSFAIRNVPPGKYELIFFHEKLKEKVGEVSIEAGKETAADFTGLERK